MAHADYERTVIQTQKKYFCSMYKKDQIKGIVAIVLFSIIGISFLLFPDGPIPEIISVVSFAIWLIAMFVLNKKFKNDE